MASESNTFTNAHTAPIDLGELQAQPGQTFDLSPEFAAKVRNSSVFKAGLIRAGGRVAPVQPLPPPPAQETLPLSALSPVDAAKRISETFDAKQLREWLGTETRADVKLALQAQAQAVAKAGG